MAEMEKNNVKISAALLHLEHSLNVKKLDQL